MRDEGVIKFDCRWVESAALPQATVAELIEYRQRLFAEDLIGVYPDGIGFGNISVRYGGTEKFIISASQTGHIVDTTPSEFVLVSEYDIAQNWCCCEGPAKASSESLTHAMIYQIFPSARAILHAHHCDAWRILQATAITTASEVPYGTPQMAAEVERLSRESALAETKFLVMAGHEDGILSFGESLAEAYETMHENLVNAGLNLRGQCCK